MTKQYKAGEFKARCLKILDDVARERETVYITKRGKIVALLVPPPEREPAEERGLEGSVLFEGDLVAPLDEPWEADS